MKGRLGIERAISAQDKAVKAERGGAKALFQEAEELFLQQTQLLRPMQKVVFGRSFQESLEIQREKQAVMEKLKERLGVLRAHPETAIETQGGPRVKADPDGTLYLNQDKEKKLITLGDIIADAEWNVLYSLDSSVSVTIRKRYIVERAKSKLRELFELQVQKLFPAGGSITHMRHLVQKFIDGPDTEVSPFYGGHIAEKMAYTLFLRESYRKGSPFKVEPGDAFGDITEKIDFRIRRTAPRRVRTGKKNFTERMLSYGVQFTIGGGAGKANQIQEVKQGGTAMVDDIFLLRVRGFWANDAVNAWKKAGKPSGGPEAFLTKKLKNKILSPILNRILTEVEYVARKEQSKQENRTASASEKPDIEHQA